MIQGIPDLRLGMRTAEVGNWQRFLLSQDVRDWEGKPVDIDEDFGPRTQHATRAWQTASSLPPTAVVTAKERIFASRYGFIPFIQARFYTRVHPSKRAIYRIVIHTMENDEKPLTAAENVAMWFAGPNSPKASPNYCVDRDSVVQNVRDMDIPWCAPGTNHDGLHIEHAGRARQTREEWLDAPSAEILLQSAKLVARLSRLYSIPVVYVGPEELKKGMRGISGHNDATLAFPGPGRTHWDPGPAFPWDLYLQMVRDIRERP